MRIMKRIAVISLTLILMMINAVKAEIPFLVYSEGWNMENTPVEVSLKASVNTHMPFDEERLAMLTPITDMLSLRLVTGNNEGKVTVSISGEDALSLQYRENAVQISCVPNTVYSATERPLNVLLGEDVTVEDGYEMFGVSSDYEALLKDARALFSKVPDALQEYGKRSKNTTNIANYGKAAYIIDYAFAAKNAATFQEFLLKNSDDGWLREIIKSFEFSGKQSLRIYFSSEDIILRVEYNGTCGPKDDLRKVKFICKMRHDTEVDKDNIELTSPAKKGKNKNTLTFDRTIQLDENGAKQIVGSYKYTVTDNNVTSIRTGDFNLRNTFSDQADYISGEMTFQSRLNGAEKYDAITLTPSISISGTQDNPLITGTVEITEKYANRVTEHAVINISVKHAEPLVWIDQPNTVDLSAMDEQEIAGVQQDVTAAIATSLVRPLIVTMGKNAQWFFRDLSEEAIEAIIEKAENAP